MIHIQADDIHPYNGTPRAAFPTYYFCLFRTLRRYFSRLGSVRSDSSSFMECHTLIISVRTSMPTPHKICTFTGAAIHSPMTSSPIIQRTPMSMVRPIINVTSFLLIYPVPFLQGLSASSQPPVKVRPRIFSLLRRYQG